MPFVDCHFSRSSNIIETLYKELLDGKTAVFVALHALTNERLINGLIELRKKGVKVLAIFDDVESKNYSDPLIKLINSDIECKTFGSERWKMKNNFMIIDGIKIISGSFNCTNQAMNSMEHVVIFEDYSTSIRFLNEFNSIWEEITSKHFKEKLGQDCYNNLQNKLESQKQAELSSAVKIRKLHMLEKDNESLNKRIKGLIEENKRLLLSIDRKDEWRYGQGTLTSADGMRKYEGEFKDGLPNGQGTLTLPDGARYEGDFKDGVRHGQGIEVSPDGTKYKGDFTDGVRHGQGTLTTPGGKKYEGQFWEGEPLGQGILTLTDGRRYEGDFDGLRHGQGALTLPNGTKYVGEFWEGEPLGQGTLTLPDGTRYEGDFKDGVRHGEGIEISPDGTKYEGDFKNGVRYGQGTEENPDGEKYEGEFKDGRFHGQGTYSYPDGKKYEGGWKDGRRHGQGILTLPDGRRHVGEWKDGKHIKGKGENDG